MRTRAICVAIVIGLAACSGDGVSIEVHRGDTTATRVELYVVDGLCTTDSAGETPCPQLKTPSATGYLDGEVYTRKDGRAFAANVESDGVAYFTILSNGDRTRVPLAVAVGFDDNDQRVGAVLLPYEVYTTDYMRVLVTLEKIVEDRVTGRPQSDGLRAETWYEDPAAPDRIGCLALESTFEGTTDRKFIVPADDLDCDGFLAADECDAIWPDHGADDDDSAFPFTCLDEESTTGSLGKRCLLGDAPCIDGQGAPECSAAKDGNYYYCVPSNLCDPLCKDSTNPSCLYAALKRPTQPALAHPSYVRCKVPIETETMHHVWRGNLEAVFTSSFGVPPTTTCSSLMLGRVTAGQLGPFATSVTSSTTPLHTITTELGPGCAPIIRIAGDFATTADMENAFPEHVARLELTNGLALIVPLVIVLEPAIDGCTNAVAGCDLVVAGNPSSIDESLAACARY